MHRERVVLFYDILKKKFLEEGTHQSLVQWVKIEFTIDEFREWLGTNRHKRSNLCTDSEAFTKFLEKYNNMKKKERGFSYIAFYFVENLPMIRSAHIYMKFSSLLRLISL